MIGSTRGLAVYADPEPSPPAHGHGPLSQPTLPLLEGVQDVVERRFVLRRHQRQSYKRSRRGGGGGSD
ncbi:hypothetical protein [Archangium sp.]|uniref:hypothetical protein n=1 Tax=Archangium sp. TaxID=1872627 RepID=UPI002D6E7A8A|nr:hypothetical protein [Archangium sp.]HYO59264.1 hypothetical protein [Archangium sp.]